MGRDVSGQTALAVNTQSAYCDGDGGWGLCGALGPGGWGLGGLTVTVRRSCLNYGAE